MKTLLINGKAWLYRKYFAEAVGFDSETGKIDFAGSNAEAVDRSPDYDEMIDVKGKLIMPAFMDGHCHLIKGALVNKELNLRDVRTRSEFAERVKKYSTENDGWIEGGYFSESNFDGKFVIDRDMLDEMCPDVPLFISRFDLHSAILNSKAIEQIGLENKKGEFSGEDLVTDNNGRLTGEVKEGARNFVWMNAPKKTTEEIANDLKDQVAKLNSLGITAVSDITLPEDLDAIDHLLNRNELDLYIDSRLPFREIENMQGYKDRFKRYGERIKFMSLKAFYDGSLTSETAYFHDNYNGREHSGSVTEFVSSGDFVKYGDMIDMNGYRMSVHAIGDKAVTELLDYNEHLVKDLGVKDRRFRIEHAQHIRKDDLDRFKKYNVIASVQPWHMFSDAKTAVEKLKHPETTHMYKLLYDMGVNVCFGTDFPVVGESPFVNMYYAMTRHVEGSDDAFYGEYRMPLEDCLTCYTINNAYASGEENSRGSLREGKIADVIVLDDLFAMTPEEIKGAKVEMTFKNGARVY